MPAACTGGPTTTALPPTSAFEVTIRDKGFQPATITVPTGSTVTWTNKDSVRRTVTSWFLWRDEDDTAHVIIGYVWDSGDIEPAETFSYTFHEPGMYDYISLPLSWYRAFELGFKGTVIVD